MSEVVYLPPLAERFPEAFNGDHFALDEVARLVELHGVKTIVETGTFEGKTAEALAAIAYPRSVVTIESDFRYYSAAGLRLTAEKYPNLKFVNDDSARCLGYWIERYSAPFLLFLDAHWRIHSPLLDELKAIADAKIRPVIVIHDFFNPTHPEYGWDADYDIGPYKWETIAESIHQIYGDNFACHYNDQAMGSVRGIVYIEPN